MIYTFRASLAPILAAVLALAVCGPAAGQLSFPLNGDFDTGTSGWTLDASAPGDLAFGALLWDGGAGAPPGSLLLRTTAGGTTSFYAAIGPCFELEPGTQYILEAEILAGSGAATSRCYPEIGFFSGTGCTGTRWVRGGGAGGPGAPAPPRDNIPGLWESWTDGPLALPDSLSFRPELLLSTSGAEAVECRYDTVRLRAAGAPAVAAIPTLGQFGFALMMGLLGLAGVLLVGRC